MSSPSSTKPSTPLPNGRSDKMKKQTKVITLRLSPTQLAQFSSAPRIERKSSTPSQTPSTPKLDIDEKTLSVTENVSESNATPVPSTDLPSSTDPTKKRKGPAPGSKRGLGQGVDGPPKQRGKPGPKKKPRLEDGTIDHSGTTKPATAPTNGVTSHKLGPKANQGAINAGLRALDRTGKPVRKWSRNPFQLKSFTGVVWEIPSWKGGQKPIRQEGDDSSETRDISQPSSSDMKPVDSSTAMDSNPGDRDQTEPMVLTPAASSPVPAPPSVVAAEA